MENKKQKFQYAIKVYSKNNDGEYTGEFIIDTRIGTSRQEVLAPYIEAEMKAEIFKEREFIDEVQQAMEEIPKRQPGKSENLNFNKPTPNINESTEILEFENGGIKFKVEGGIVRKYDWANCSEFKLHYVGSENMPAQSKQFIKKLEEIIKEHPDAFEVQTKAWIEVT